MKGRGFGESVVWELGMKKSPASFYGGGWSLFRLGFTKSLEIVRIRKKLSLHFELLDIHVLHGKNF